MENPVVTYIVHSLLILKNFFLSFLLVFMAVCVCVCVCVVYVCFYVYVYMYLCVFWYRISFILSSSPFKILSFFHLFFEETHLILNLSYFDVSSFSVLFLYLKFALMFFKFLNTVSVLIDLRPSCLVSF